MDITQTSPVAVSELNVGDVISDDLAVKITAINRFDLGDVTLHVVQWTGDTYMIRTSEDAKRIRYGWSAEDWEAYCEL